MGQPTQPAESAPAAEPTTDPAKTEPPATGDALGETGKKLLTEMRQQIKELEKQNKALQDRDPVKVLMEALGQKPEPGKDAMASLTEQVTALQRQHAEAELKATRLEVAAAKGLTPAQAARLQGATREELEADAEQLKQLFPGTPGTPAPDPSQGARGGPNQLEALLKAAQDKGDAKEAIRIKNLLAAAKRGR